MQRNARQRDILFLQYCQRRETCQKIRGLDCKRTFLSFNQREESVHVIWSVANDCLCVDPYARCRSSSNLASIFNSNSLIPPPILSNETKWAKSNNSSLTYDVHTCVRTFSLVEFSSALSATPRGGLEELVPWVVQQKALVAHVHFGVHALLLGVLPLAPGAREPCRGAHTAGYVACATSPGAPDSIVDSSS